MLPWKLRKRHILPASQNLLSVYFSLAKFQLVNCNLSLAMIWQMTCTHKLPKLCSATLKGPEKIILTICWRSATSNCPYKVQQNLLIVLIICSHNFLKFIIAVVLAAGTEHCTFCCDANQRWLMLCKQHKLL